MLDVLSPLSSTLNEDDSQVVDESLPKHIHWALMLFGAAFAETDRIRFAFESETPTRLAFAVSFKSFDGTSPVTWSILQGSVEPSALNLTTCDRFVAAVDYLNDAGLRKVIGGAAHPVVYSFMDFRAELVAAFGSSGTAPDWLRDLTYAVIKSKMQIPAWSTLPDSWEYAESQVLS